MLGAIAGDIVGSVHEFAGTTTKNFPLFGPGACFTDDTVLTVAVADSLMRGEAFATGLLRWGRRYPDAGYGGRFRQWLETDGSRPYGSYGNGSAMRVSPVGWAANSVARARALAAASANPTHNHPEAVKGAQATAMAMVLARRKHSPEEIRRTIQDKMGYDLSSTVASIRDEKRGYDISCRGTVPPALICALEATDYEDAIRNAVSLGGDADTLACIAGGLAEILYGIPPSIKKRAFACLDPALGDVVRKFQARYVQRSWSKRVFNAFFGP